MASVYRTYDKNGKPHPCWRYRYRDAQGKKRKGTGWPDKKRTLEPALSLEAECRAIRKGEKPLPASWLKTRHVPIDQIITEYMAWGRAQGGRGGRPWDEQNARLRHTDLQWWRHELSLVTLHDIDLVRVEQLARRRLSQGYAPKSVALRVESLRALCLWAVKRGMLPSNPLLGLSRFDTRPRSPHRSLTDDEVALLLGAAPLHRRLWYEGALETGFRLNERRCLRVKDLDLPGPSLFLASDFSKDRKAHRQPIRVSMRERLRLLVEGKKAEERLLGIPKGIGPSESIAKDYQAAGVILETPEGKATWHSLRKVYINGVVTSGADLKTIMTLARHSSATLSMETYAAADPTLLRQSVEAAMRCRSALLPESTGPTGRPQHEGEVSIDAVTEGEGKELREEEVVGDTGLEFVRLHNSPLHPEVLSQDTSASPHRIFSVLEGGHINATLMPICESLRQFLVTRWGPPGAHGHEVIDLLPGMEVWPRLSETQHRQILAIADPLSSTQETPS